MSNNKVWTMTYTETKEVSYTAEQLLCYVCGVGNKVRPPCDNAREVLVKMVVEHIQEHLDKYHTWRSYRLISDGYGHLKRIEIDGGNEVIPVTEFIERHYA